MIPERAIWFVILAPLCLILAPVVLGPGPVNAAFEWVFDGLAWIVLVWLALLGVL